MTGPGVYVHVPFCAHRCSYCSFVTFAGRQGEEGYFEALEREAEARLGDLGGAAETLYFGGGTPSYVEAGRLGRLAALVGLPGLAEVTAEVSVSRLTR